MNRSDIIFEAEDQEEVSLETELAMKMHRQIVSMLMRRDVNIDDAVEWATRVMEHGTEVGGTGGDSIGPYAYYKDHVIRPYAPRLWLWYFDDDGYRNGPSQVCKNFGDALDEIDERDKP